MINRKQDYYYYSIVFDKLHFDHFDHCRFTKEVGTIQYGYRKKRRTAGTKK